MPVQAPIRDNPFYGYSKKLPDFSRFYDAHDGDSDDHYKFVTIIRSLK